MFMFGNNKPKELYKEMRDKKDLSEVIGRYKVLSEKDKEKFRGLLAQDLAKSSNDKEKLKELLGTAVKIGENTEWRDVETDNNLVEVLRNILERYEEDSEIAKMILDVLEKNNYGDPKFWSDMLYKNDEIAAYVAEKIADVEGGEELLKENLPALLPLLSRSKKCREIVSAHIAEQESDIKKSFIGMVMENGLYQELLPALPKLFEDPHSRLMLVSWLADNGIKIRFDLKEQVGEEQIQGFLKEFLAVQKEIIEKAIRIVSSLDWPSKFLISHFLLSKGIFVKDAFNEDDKKSLKGIIFNKTMNLSLRKSALQLFMLASDENTRKQIEEQIIKEAKSYLSSAAVRDQIEAYFLSKVLYSYDQQKGKELLQAVYKENLDVLEDPEARQDAREVSAKIVSELKDIAG
jgi:hypothetical protein